MCAVFPRTWCYSVYVVKKMYSVNGSEESEKCVLCSKKLSEGAVEHVKSKGEFCAFYKLFKIFFVPKNCLITIQKLEMFVFSIIIKDVMNFWNRKRFPRKNHSRNSEKFSKLFESFTCAKLKKFRKISKNIQTFT